MVDCAFPCNSGTKEHITMSIPVAPTRAISGDVVTVSVDITDHSLLYGGTATVNFVDTNSGLCVYAENIPWLSQGTTRTIVYQFIMSASVNLRISVATWIVPITTPLPPPYWNCEDVKYANIVLYDPGADRWACTADKQCVSSPSGTYFSKSECDIGCGGGNGGGVCDTSKNMNVMGICVPKQVVFLGFALAAIYIMK